MGIAENIFITDPFTGDRVRVDTNGKLAIAFDADEQPTDETTGALKTIDYAHHEIHDGSHFKAGYQDITMDTDDIIALVFTTPDSTKFMHWTMTAQTTGAATIQLFSGPTLSAEGTAVTPFNRNQNSDKESVMVVRHTPTITLNGTKISEKWVGGVGFKETIGGETRGSSEIILKRNTQYLILCTANADGIKCAIGGDWYEHTNL